MKHIITIISMVILCTACATIQVPAETPATGPVYGHITSALNKLANNPILVVGIADSQRTLRRIDDWHDKGQITPLREEAARACPNMTILTVQDIYAGIDETKAFLAVVDSQILGLTDGNFTGIIEPLTIAKYGPKTAETDLKSFIDSKRDRFLDDIRTWQRACANLIPDTKIRDLMEQAAGLVVPLP